MQKKHRSIVQRVSFILIWMSVLNFLGGCFVLSRLEKSNTEYIYQLLQEVQASSIRELEEKLTDIQDTLYRLVVSDGIQEAGSLLLAYGEEEEDSSAWQRASVLNTIVDGIQNGIRSDQAIVCANFLYDGGQVRVAASTSYYRLSAEDALMIEESAAAAQGQDVFFDGEALTGEENLLVVAKAFREKKNLSLAHIGTIVLFVDVDELGKIFTDVHDGIFVLEAQDGTLQYVLNDRDGEIEDLTLTDLVTQEEGYSLEKVDGRKWFVAKFDPGGFFSYTFFDPYSELSRDIQQIYGLYVSMFTLFIAAALIIACMSTRRVTRDIRQFIRHISNISCDGLVRLPMYEVQNIRDKDVYALKEAFNAMSSYINELVRDNYTKQLLVKETRLRALQSQMNPHFLYNTLNSLYWMAKTSEMPEAADMISSLSVLLREAISEEEFVITIDQELDIVCHYLIIQKYRYEDRLDVHFDVSEECSSLVIPRFTLQPLVENAIAYGLECMLGACTIKIKIFLEEEVCVCQVRNTGPEPEEDIFGKLQAGILKPRGNGIGLMNIWQRLQFVFGEDCAMAILREGDETVAQIRMRMISLEEYRTCTGFGGKTDGRNVQDDGGR